MKFDIHAGSFGKGTGFFDGVLFSLPGKQIYVSNLESVSIASEENVKTLAGTVGWSAAGVALLGPLGLLSGLLSKNKKRVTFIALFKGGRKLLGTADNKVYLEMQKATF